MSQPNTVVMDETEACRLGMRTEDGWIGVFTRHEAPGALFKNRTAIIKVKDETGDRTPLGTRRTVLGSLYHPSVGVGYFVEWATQPRNSRLRGGLENHRCET